MKEQKDLTVGNVQEKIYQLPNRPPFMLGLDLAEIYETKPEQIRRAVTRNPDRFPEDFCFLLEPDEIKKWSSQNDWTGSLQNEGTTIPSGPSGTRAFTRLGANMLSAVLKTPKAAARSVMIMRAFSAIEERLIAEERGPGKSRKDSYRDGFAVGMKRGLALSEIYESLKVSKQSVAEYCYFRQTGNTIGAAAGAANIRVAKATEIELILGRVGVTLPRVVMSPRKKDVEAALEKTLQSTPFRTEVPALTVLGIEPAMPRAGQEVGNE